MFGLTAAHRELPLGSHVRVTNLQNHRRVVVRINDRPRRGSAMIDLSYAAAKILGMTRRGWAKVRVDLLKGARDLEGAAPALR